MRRAQDTGPASCVATVTRDTAKPGGPASVSPRGSWVLAELVADSSCLGFRFGLRGAPCVDPCGGSSVVEISPAFHADRSFGGDSQSPGACRRQCYRSWHPERPPHLLCARSRCLGHPRGSVPMVGAHRRAEDGLGLSLAGHPVCGTGARREWISLVVVVVSLEEGGQKGTKTLCK